MPQVIAVICKKLGTVPRAGTFGRGPASKGLLAESKHLHSTGQAVRGPVDVRDALLSAALRVFATSGSRGATTRRIAQEAGLNEVTLFRHFGSKDSLIQEALAWKAEQFLRTSPLPDDPRNPVAELVAFCEQYHEGLTQSRALIRTCLAEFEEHPDATRLACRTPIAIAEQLEAYLERLRQTGLAAGDWSARAATSMLMGTLFSDAMSRDCMPERHTLTVPEAIRQYVAVFLRGIGAAPAPVPAARPTTSQE